jgi:eukaryotic-like serine/threonine-protein kinase
LIGQYKVIKLLGEGGFGKTYLAEHVLLGKKVALKQSHFASAEAQQMLLEESSLLWDVNHWALPTVKDVIVHNSSLVMAMSFVDGDELLKHVTEHGPVDPETACWIAQRVLSALYYLHFRGIVHRDVKPPNIIVNFDTHIATLVDFGLSKLRPDGSPDPSGYTPGFASPEQILGKAPLPESDIYSLGMTLLYILGGDLNTPSLPPNLPDPLAEFINDMLCQDPMARPRDAKNLNTRLTSLRKLLFGRAHKR